MHLQHDRGTDRAADERGHLLGRHAPDHHVVHRYQPVVFVHLEREAARGSGVEERSGGNAWRGRWAAGGVPAR